MAASNSTPIQLYYSNTTGSVPISTSLILGELAINVPDGIIFYKDSSNNVNVIARTSAAAGQFANVTFGDGSIQYKGAAPWQYTNSIHALANTAITDIIYLQGVNAAQNTTIGAGQSYANGAFARANNGYDVANSGFDKANTAYLNTLDLAGVDVLQNTNIALASSFANGAFTKANTNATNITNIQGVNSTQNTTIQNSWDRANSGYDHANTAYNLVVSGDTESRSYANGAFAAANTNATSIAYIQGVDLSQNAHTTNVGVYANNAFTKANNALANTNSITVTNNLTVPGQANVYNRLAVGTGSYQVLPNLIAQFTGTSDTYSQVNQQNLSANGTGDFVITADNGTDATNYTDMGMAGSTYDNTSVNAFPMVQPNDGYFMVVGDSGAAFGGNVFIGTSGSGSFGDIVFIQGNNYDEVARFKAGDKIEFYRPIVANSFTTVDGINLLTHTNNANTYLKGLIDTKVSKSGDTITGVLSIDGSSSANSLSVTGNVYISNDLRVSGNLYIGGNATSISANNLTLDDSIIYIANNNPSNVIDIGIAGAFNDGTYQHTGFVRDATDGKWKLFSNVVSEPTTTINFTNAKYDTLKLGTVETANITVSGLDLAAHTNTAFDKANSAYTLADGKVSSVSGTSGRVSASGTSTVTIDLATSGVVAGSYNYPSLQVDSYGRVTTISTQTPVTSFNTRTGAVSLGSNDVTSALGFTPVDTVNYNNDLLTQSSLDASQNTRIVNVGSFANGAFYKANTAGIYANGAFDKANTTNDLFVIASQFANGSFDKANTASDLSTSAYEKANSVGNFANGSFTYANTTNALTVNAYDKANNAGNFANGAFDKANTAYSVGGILVGVYANNAFATANVSFIKANNVGEFANGAFLNANLAFDRANSAYTIGGGLVGEFANGAFTTANSAFDKANVTYFLADASFLRANVAFDEGNTNATKITFTGTYANGAFTKANTVGAITNLAYDKANNSSEYANGAFELSNTTNTLATNAGNFANGAFTAANTTNTLATNAGNFANGSFSQVNVAFGVTNSAYDWANTVYSNFAAPASANTINLAIVNAEQNTNISLIGSFANASYDTANAGFTKANNTGDFANGAFGLANTTATTLALEQAFSNAAFTQANTNATAITNLQAVDVTQNTSIASILSIATSAFDTANAEVIGTGAYNRANASYELANTNATAISNTQGVDAWQNTYAQQIHSTSNGAFLKANSAWTLANDAYAYANTLITGGTSVDGWARGHANAAYNTANTATADAATSLSYALSSFQKANTIVSPTYTTSDTPPNNPSTSAIWYNTTNDVMYQWVTGDGTNYYWIDIGSPTVTVGNTTISYTYTGYGRAAAHAMIFGGF